MQNAFGQPTHTHSTMAINLHHPFHKATGTGLYLPPSRSRPLLSNAAAQSKPISWALAYPRPTVVSQQCDADAAKGVVQHDVVSLPTNRPVVSSWDIPRAEEQSMTVAAPKGKRKSASTQLQQLLAADSVSASLLLRNNELLSRAVNKNRSMPDAQNKSALPSTLEDSRRPLEKTVHVTPGQKESTLSTLKSSLDLSGFHSTQLTFGNDTVVPSNVSISSQESTDTSPNKTIAMYKTSQATTISPEHNSLTTAKPRTVIDFAAAAAAKRKETAPSPYKQQVVYLECPLDFLSRVCESATLQCPSTRDPQFHSTNEPNYPMNLVEDPSTTFLFTNKQQQPSSNTITRRRSKTDLLIQAMEEEHKPLEWTNDPQPPQQRVSTSKRKSPNEDTICLDKLGDLIHKRHKVSNNTSTTPSIQSDPMALQAFLVADRALQDPKIWKQLLFSMTITRDWKQRVRGVSEPPPGIVLEKAFLWSVYPSLETVLIDNMREYYEMSMDKACTKEQLVFNNRLLSLVKETAAKKGWIWGEGYNTDKKIRNRVRCYYKVSLSMVWMGV